MSQTHIPSIRGLGLQKLVRLGLLIFLQGFQLFDPQLSQREVAARVVAGLALVRLKIQLGIRQSQWQT